LLFRTQNYSKNKNMDVQINIKTRMNAIVEYLDYEVPVTQQQSDIEMRQLTAISIYGYVGGRQI